MPETFNGPIIRTRYSGAGSRVIADHRRDSETVWRASHAWDCGLSSDANHAAAAALILPRFSQPMVLVARGHDADAYYWLAVGAWQLADARTLDAIAELLSGTAWSAGTVDAVADLVRSTGRAIADL